jgi:hypothetical protein
MYLSLMPPQRRLFNASVQTEDPDTTLSEIDPSVFVEGNDKLKGDSENKKRKTT